MSGQKPEQYNPTYFKLAKGGEQKGHYMSLQEIFLNGRMCNI